MRMIMAAVAVLAAGGCAKDEAEEQATVAAPTGAPARTAAAPAAPAAGETKAFRDWDATCDNTNSCTLFGFQAGDPWDRKEADGWGFVRVERSAGPAGEPVVLLATGEFTGEEQSPTVPLQATVDGGRVFRLTATGGGGPYYSGELRGAQAGAFLAAIRDGRTATLTAKGFRPGVVSLNGAAAALLWADERQGRVGTVTALARSGDRPASTVPADPAPPVVRAVKADGRRVAWSGSDARVTECLSEMPDGYEAEATGHRLTEELVLWEVPCGAGAYNVTTAFFFGDTAGGGLRPVRLNLQEGEGYGAVNHAVNAGFDAATGTIGAFAKGRGSGDCGSEQTWAWDGRGFVLSHDRTMGRCEGVWADHWPVLHRAEVR